MAFYGSCFEPAVFDRALKREPASPATSPYGTFDTMLATLKGQLREGPYLLGERLTAADFLWGGALRWITMFGLLPPEQPEIAAYVGRVTGRPSFAAADARDQAWAAEQAAAGTA